MKILVIDDGAVNLRAATAQLKGHELTLAGSYDEGLALIQGEKNKETHEYDQPGQYDVVLTDLMMPASDYMLGPKGWDFAGQEMPVGIFLALLAAQKGAKYVAIFTDGGHHDHPAFACLDAFSSSQRELVPFMVAGAKTVLCNFPGWIEWFPPDNLTQRLESYAGNPPHVVAKNWKKLLDELTTEFKAKED
jgi:CheY-like chemotaxis protein